jgi:6-phosphogluconate dehydrogenase
MKDAEYVFGMVGLGVMGRNLALNLADHGFSVAGHDKEGARVGQLQTEAADKNVAGFESMQAFVAHLEKPRTLMLLVPAGRPVDSVLDDVVPLLDAGDLVIDGGNSHYADTDRRAGKLAERRVEFIGMGVSGGEKGARHGPSMMPGGSRQGYERIREILKAAAAHVDGDPCVTYLGPGSAGHYVKMVHNGIEYALIQLLAETYDLMKRGLGYDNDAMHEVYAGWNEGDLQSFLVEITAAIFERRDEKSGNRLVDMIRDEARQKGTGRWTSQDAMNLQVPIPTIDAAVSARELSAFKAERVAAANALSVGMPAFKGDARQLVEALGHAYRFAMIVSYAQGMKLLQTAAEKYAYGTDLSDVARIWRGGCIIRAKLLEDVRAAFEEHPDLPNLIMAPRIRAGLTERHEAARRVVRAAVEMGLPAPAFAASLAYFDGYRSARLPANLIQAERDYFGAHTYERTDAEGTFHTDWAGE